MIRCIDFTIPDDSIHNRESQSTARGFGCKERIEHASLRLACHPTSIVRDLEFDVFVCLYTF